MLDVILFQILPCAIALNERCFMVDIVLKQAHIPPQPAPPIRVRDQKYWHGRKRWQRIACHPCELPQVASIYVNRKRVYAHRPCIELRYEL